MSPGRGSAFALAILVVASACQTSAPTPAPTPVEPGTVSITVPIVIEDKAVIQAAVDVLSDRLDSLGYESWDVAIGDSIVFTLPAAPPPDEAKIREAFTRRGSVSLIPLPAEASIPAAGDPAPTGVPPLSLPVDEVISAMVVQDPLQGSALQIDLGPAGGKAVATYTAGHVGDYLVLALDGTVLASPIIQSPIPDWHVLISMPPDEPNAMPLDLMAALIGSGPLPAGWP